MQLLDDLSSVNKALRKEWANTASFAALTPLGRVITWGNSLSGAINSIQVEVNGLTSNVTQIYSCLDGYTALRSDGTAISWRDGKFTTINAETPEKKIRSISSTMYAFAALRADGSVVTWGSGFGGDSSSVKENIASGVKDIYSNRSAFAALKTDGSVVTWGDSSCGGDIRLIADSLKAKVVKVFSTDAAFAALKSDGSVVTWGDIQRGGDSSAKSGFLTSGVREIFSTGFAFAALKTDGSVVTWGGPNGYGGADSSQVAAKLQNEVKWIYANGGAFAALKKDGSVVTWGDPNRGGNSSVAVFNGAKYVYTSYADQLRSGVEKIFSTNNAFAALKTNGSVVTWGGSDEGGNSFLNKELQSGVIDIAATGSAFAALKSDGSVFTWGQSTVGGDSSNVRSLLSSGIQKIYANDTAFAALRSDGTVVTWGIESDGGQPSITKYKFGGGPFQESLPSSLSGIANIAEASSDIWLEFPVPPATPDITSVGGSDSVVTSQSNDKAVFGTAIAGITVTIKSGSNTLGTTSANASGVFSYGLTVDNLTMLGQGTGKSVTAIASDSAGNTSAASSTFGFAVQTTPIIRGNSLYTIVDGPSWTQAEANSVKLGGHLTSISSKSENDFVQELAKQNSDPLLTWIGGTDEQKEGVWKWTTGELWAYTNWSASEPNNNSWGAGMAENYLAIYKADGTWNDNFSGNWAEYTTTRGISETSFIRRGDSAYVIVQGPTWEEAEANAVKLGGHLVTINDAAENDWIMDSLASTVNKGKESENWVATWFGLTRNVSLDGSWSWASGEDLTYTNWYNNVPGTLPYGKLYTSHREIGNELAPGHWNGWSSQMGGNQVTTGIAEIKLAPNNAPTGTPTLSGTFKAGQVVTIDSTPIQDADNFTGYTPTYNYSFEVSNDNGTTWTKLTSTDATDNNSTYTLTTAELGKKVRGVVSYLDGYGTNESVATAGSSVISAPVVRGNSLYTIVDGPSWTQAEANSVKLGGHLTAINDKQENDWIASEFSKDRYDYQGDQNPWDPPSWHHLYLGGLQENGAWKWSNGEKWWDNFRTEWVDPSRTDTPVLSGLFNIYLRGQYYLGDGQGTFVWYPIPDLTQSAILSQNKDGKGIAETPFIRRGDSAYVIVQGPTWEEAEANAVKLGGHLVTINDASENDFIKSNSFFDKPNETAWYAIGLNKKSQDLGWHWISGESTSYRSWDQSNGDFQPEPNSDWATPNFAYIGRGFNYHPNWKSSVSGAEEGSWYDDSNLSSVLNANTVWGLSESDYPVKSYGIAEIRLAPNNAPTGTPTLLGTFKVGQTISIDKTSIQDSDNFNGYSPAYNYTWEVSKYNALSQVPVEWVPLTKADATDNNNTYTLTAADVGKMIRGVVSYMDGYGTNESVASADSTNVVEPSNTAPTAVQILTGSSKVGRVLTADKSTIVDPDGVPTAVSYGWEVSSNGTTWSKLTSADATDNNSTYALTAGELGKTVRSVISYTDGYGTNETVWSAATTAVVAGNKPTSISLSLSSIAENIGANKAVATLRSVDVDTDDAYTYALVNGTGSTDNRSFTIAGDKLTIISNPDFETKNSYSIRVRTTDLGGLSVDKNLVLKVTNVNEAPIAINLSDSDFLENIAAGSVIGSLSSLDPDKDTTFTYSLTPNSPRATFADNQFFSIVNDQLKINGSANFEQKDTYTISVRSTDAGKLFYDQVFTLVVQDVDEAPTDISITGTGIEEGAAVGSIVGTLVSTDQDESSTDFTYELVAGTKANNNDLFEIVGDQLKSKATFNFETKSSYVVNVRTTDEAGLTFDKSVTIKVNNVNENPTDLTVSATAFNENVAIGSTVATLGFVDPDKTGTYTYSLVSGIGDKDNQAFLIAGNALKVNVATNFEIQKTYAVRLRVTDQGGLFFEKSVALGVNNLVEKVSSGVSTTLAPDKDTLELTGTKNVFGMGNQFDNTIIGNSGRNKLAGGMGKDILTGGAGVDTFFYNDLKESLLSGFDVITDYSAGEKINAGFLFEGDDLITSTGKASALNEGAIGSVLTNTTFLANNAAAFTIEGLTGTFLALNDGRDGFQADSDALIHLSKYTIGSTTPISII